MTTLKTTAEMFAPLIAGRYTGSPGVLWHQIEQSWTGFTLSDEDLDRLDGIDGDWVQRVQAAVTSRSAAAMLVWCDQAEEAGVNPELCDLTRRALRMQYP